MPPLRHCPGTRLGRPVFLGFSVAQLVKNPPALQETWVRPLSWEDPLGKGTATHSSILPGELHGLYSPQGQKDSTEQLSLHSGLCCMVYGSVGKQACVVLWVSKPAFLRADLLTGVSVSFYLQSSGGTHYFITCFVPSLCPCHLDTSVCNYKEPIRADPSQEKLGETPWLLPPGNELYSATGSGWGAASHTHFRGIQSGEFAGCTR